MANVYNPAVYSVVYRPTTPALAVRPTGGRELGRCYYEHTFEVRSDRKLKREAFDALEAAGFLGYGQGFHIGEPTEEVELVTALGLNYAGEVIEESPVNRYSGQPSKPMERTIYVYVVTRTVDSSD